MRRLAVALITAASLAAPSAALANSTNNNYSPAGTPKQQKKAVAPTSATRTPGGTVDSATATRSVASSSLPFTGIDVLVLASGGVLLLAAGLVVRRLSLDN